MPGYGPILVNPLGEIATASGRVNFGGEALATSNIALGAGWGTGASATMSGSCTAQRFRFTVTCGASPSANPVTTITFPGGSWPSGARAMCRPNGGTGSTPSAVLWSQPSTTIAITHVQTPVEASTYAVDVIIMG